MKNPRRVLLACLVAAYCFVMGATLSRNPLLATPRRIARSALRACARPLRGGVGNGRTENQRALPLLRKRPPLIRERSRTRTLGPQITDYPHRREGRSSAFVDDDIHVLTPIRGKIQRIKTT